MISGLNIAKIKLSCMHKFVSPQSNNMPDNIHVYIYIYIVSENKTKKTKQIEQIKAK